MVDWSKSAFLFPGQGSQVVGMGKDVAKAYPAARQLFERADAYLGFALSAICFEGPSEVLNDTINTQPALYVCSLALLAALRTELPEATPRAVAGHSFGEFTALAAVDALDFEDGLRLVRERGRLMQEAGKVSPGAMAALLALEIEAVRAICAQAAAEVNGILVVANDNCPGQIVISGEDAALERGLVLAKEAGARRAIKLAVSIAAHSPLMAPAAEAFAVAIHETRIKAPTAPVYANVSAMPLTAVADIQQELEAQLTNPVRWRESMNAMIADGLEVFIEIGPKDVLSGLMKRITAENTTVAVNSIDTLRSFLN
ncbi:MAG: ACP S-malonyltransferase [Anaerolineae bacterium]|nr:ACP S-malonyltransferase [Anaerolineae bacterium]NUQ02644.1 ACP S-malonyltransferase [Anaerolineae bacterium]